LEILIVGGGLTGSTLAARLAANGHDVVVVERDPEHARRLSGSLDVRVVEGNGSTARVLREAGIENADITIAMTESDEVNMVVAMLAAQVFQVPRLLARLRDPDHVADFEGIAAARAADYRCFNPELAAVDRILALLEVRGAIDVVEFLGGGVVVAGFRITERSDLAGMMARDMSLLFADHATLVIAIQRGPAWTVPNGGETLRAGDIAYFAIARPDVQAVVGLVLGDTAEAASGRARVLIAGATRLGLALARRLDRARYRVALVDPDAGVAREAAERLEGVLIVHGRPCDQALLEEEEVERAAAFVAVSNDYEENLVAGLLARRLGADRAFALVDNPDLVRLIGGTSIDAFVSPRLLAVSLALQHVRGGGVRSVAALLEHEVELLEAEVTDAAPLVLATLSEIGIPPGTLVAAVQRGERTFVPRGGDRVQVGDRVVMVTTSARAPEVAKLLGARHE
jgi:trk system potassium uptake protein TrkA